MSMQSPLEAIVLSVVERRPYHRKYGGGCTIVNVAGKVDAISRDTGLRHQPYNLNHFRLRVQRSARI